MWHNDVMWHIMRNKLKSCNDGGFQVERIVFDDKRVRIYLVFSSFILQHLNLVVCLKDIFSNDLNFSHVILGAD